MSGSRDLRPQNFSWVKKTRAPKEGRGKEGGENFQVSMPRESFMKYFVLYEEKEKRRKRSKGICEGCSRKERRDFRKKDRFIAFLLEPRTQMTIPKRGARAWGTTSQNGEEEEEINADAP